MVMMNASEKERKRMKVELRLESWNQLEFVAERNRLLLTDKEKHAFTLS